MSSPIINSPVEEDILDEAARGSVDGEVPAEIAGRSLSQLAWMRLRRDRVALISMAFLLTVLVIAMLAPLAVAVLRVDPYTFDTSAISAARGGLPQSDLPGWLGKAGISWDHPLGVEPLSGRDILARLIYGARISLFVAFTATLLTTVIGTIVGTVSGYLGGWVDGFFGRLMDLILAFPLLIMLLSLSTPLIQRLEAMGVPKGNPARLTYLILVFAVFGWPYIARIVRGQVVSLREREFVESAVAMGAGSRRIVFRELIPNLWAPILVYATITLPAYISAEAALAFLGVGVLEPQATWGKMLADSVRYSKADPLYLFIPGLALFLVVLAFNLLGDSVRDALDPRAGRV
ncbi:MAG: ABC transporter permease [Actinomycetota bacterium]|nr:ABC transporter permease [Actinomycetota bacterium]